MSIIKPVDFPSFGDDRGGLVAIEACKTVPFEIKRVYYISKTKEGVSRGYHAHLNLKQVAVCLTGSCRFVLNDGFYEEDVILDSSTKGILIEGLIWREIHDFSPDCVLMVLASDHFDESDYIRDYQAFIDKARLQK